MGRKRLTKQCSKCLQQCERKQFPRSMWEKDDESEFVAERLCRNCMHETKQTKERQTLAGVSTMDEKAIITFSPSQLPILASDLFSNPENGLIPLEEDDFDVEGDLLDSLDNVLEGPDEKGRRSMRAKRRRAKMNFLFSSLAEDVGLPAFSDRARVLEKTREVIRELREARESKKMKLDLLRSVERPLVSIKDVVSSHLLSAQADIVTHSPLA